MKLCCCTVCFHDLKLDEALKNAAAAGFKAIELVAVPNWIHFTAGKDDSSALRALLEKHRLRMVALHAGGISCLSPKAANASVDYFEKAIALMKQFGARQLVFTGSPREKGGSLQNAVAALKRLSRIAEGEGVRVGLENHYKNWFETLADYDMLLGELIGPAIGITMDTGHFTSSRVDMSDLIEKHGRRIYHVHIKDHVGTQSVAIGAGETRNARHVAELARAGFEGFLSLELEVKDKENAPRYVAEARPLMQKWVADAKAQTAEPA